MFPPQPREHFFGYLLGEAWHFHRDCNTLKPKEDGGACRNLVPERKRNSQPQIHGNLSHTAPQQLPCSSNQQKPEQHPVQAGLIPVKERWIQQHPSSGLFPRRAGMFQLKWGRFSYLGFQQNIPKELPRQRQAGKIHYNHRQQTGIGDRTSLPQEFCIAARALEWQSRIM